METRFTRLVGCVVPLQQAGMGGAATPALVAAVAEAGALGMLGLAGAPPERVGVAVDAVASSTGGAFGVNFLMPFLDPAAVEVAAPRCKVVEFFYGDPDAGLVNRVHEGGALASWQVGSLGEAEAAADAGCDLVVVQGVEAGGHVRGEVGLLTLLDLVLDKLEVPVLAGGGIGSARSVAAVLAAGASGARVGTRFLAAREADVHPEYLAALVAAGAEDTVLTRTFSGNWPDAPHRVLKGCVREATASSEEVVGTIARPDGDPVGLPRLSTLPPGRTVSGRIGAMALYAGQGVGHVRQECSAAEIVDELGGGAEVLLSTLH